MRLLVLPLLLLAPSAYLGAAATTDCFKYTPLECFYIRVDAIGLHVVCQVQGDDPQNNNIVYGDPENKPENLTKSTSQCGIALASLPNAAELRPKDVATALKTLLTLVLKAKIVAGDPCGGFIAENACPEK